MSPERPLLSILLLCHNEAVFIRRALRSILSQSLEGQVEILLLDDHSVDGSAALAEAEIAAKGRANFSLRVLRHDRQRGNAQAFVTALGAARGRYYHVLDGDDFWIDPDKLAKQIAQMEANPTLAGIGHRSIVRSAIDGSESFHPQREPLKPVLQIEDFLGGELYFHTSAMLYRNSFFDPASGRSQVPEIFQHVRGDTIRLYVHAFRGGIRYLPQTMSVYDSHRAGIWSGLDWPGRRDLLNNLHLQLANHGYLADMGEEKASAFLTAQLAAIAAYAPSSLRPISLHPDQIAQAPRQRLTEISRISSLLDLERQLSSLSANGQYEEALRLVFRFLSALAYDPNISALSQSRRITSPEIDWHCAHIGGLIAARDKILPQPVPAEDSAEGPLVLLVSGMDADRDGMWAMTRDMVALWRGRRRIVILSTELLPTHPETEARLGGEVELLLNTDQGLAEKTAWLIWHIARLKPAQILVNPARNDVVIAAGLRREHAPRIHLLGSYLAGYLPMCHSYALDGYVARRPYDVAWFHQLAPQREVAHLPLFAQTPAAPADLSPDTPLVTVTAGPSAEALEARYDYSLDLVIPLLLGRGVHRHIHIGPLSDSLLNRIRKELLRQGFGPEAFGHYPGSGDLAADLQQSGAKIFLQGFPQPDAAALIAALSIGLPVIAHDNYLNPAFSLRDLCPPETPCWSDGAGLRAILAEVGPDWLERQRAAVLAHMAQRTAGAPVLAEALGAQFMAPLTAAQIPQARVPEDGRGLRRLLTEAMEMTVFRV